MSTAVSPVVSASSPPPESPESTKFKLSQQPDSHSTNDTVTPHVRSSNEYDCLRSVIVGRLDGFCFPPPHSAVLRSVPAALAKLLPTIGGTPPPAELMQLAQAELDAMIDVLEAHGVRVYRPTAPVCGASIIETRHWRSTQMGTACVRDSVLIVDQHIIEAPMSWRCRVNETAPMQPLFKQIVNAQSDAKWTIAPRPQLTDELFVTSPSPPSINASSSSSSSSSDPSLPTTPVITSFAINNLEPVFDAADFIRCDDRLLLGQLSNATNALGVQWLRKLLGDTYKIVLVDQKCTSPLHIDCTIVSIGPKKLLINPKYIDASHLPEFIQREWKIIVGPPPVQVSSPYSDYNLCSPNLAYNLLMLDEHTAIVDVAQIALIAMLEAEGIKCIPLSNKFLSPFGGAFHCFTLDLERQTQTNLATEIPSNHMQFSCATDR